MVCNVSYALALNMLMISQKNTIIMVIAMVIAIATVTATTTTMLRLSMVPLVAAMKSITKRLVLP